jgi:signal transduction histidine kinase
MTSVPAPTPPKRWQRVAAASVRGFHAYANWLVGISWRRFVLLSLLLLVASAILKEIPPFSWTYTRQSALPLPSVTIAPPPVPGASAPTAGARRGDVEVRIDRQGVHITRHGEPAGAPASGASAAAPGASAADQEPAIEIRVPENADNADVRDAVQEAKQAIEEAVRDARDGARDAADAAREQRDVAREAQRAIRAATRVHRVSIGEFLPNLALFWILASAIVKITYKRQIQAEAQAAQAVETAEAEALKRQVVEARMAAMQAQVEPHFLFNTLASIDHLIEVDPQRASQMQKNLIALLRASMPTLREASDGGVRELGRELAMVRPYLEILNVRMEERLATSIDVPDGLLSAEFPPMMLQTLVENAIKHGLEPKPDGGRLDVKAEVVHGRLVVTVADTGLGFGRGETAGTGVGLANVRERLALRYGTKATLTIAENPGGGTVATIALPYRPIEAAAA